MPLMTTKPMFDLAYTGGYAVGAFNVNNMELAQSIIDACAKESSPLILEISGLQPEPRVIPAQFEGPVDCLIGEKQYRQRGWDIIR